MSTPNHLIVVCGHAIWAGGPSKGHDESEWLIESYKKGETPTFIEHIKAGVKELSEDERSVLMFSGGSTKKETPLSEGRSYANLAAANSNFGLLSSTSNEVESSAHPLSPIPFHPRILVEERALDSYQNILFSIIHFWRSQDCKVWPSRLTIVSHAFKRRRLAQEHCAAIMFPLERVVFVGINPPRLVLVDGELPSEVEAVRSWKEDPHGVGDELAGKRRQRNLWGLEQKLFLTEEERRKSGLQTVSLNNGAEEMLIGNGPRPWSIEPDT